MSEKDAGDLLRHAREFKLMWELVGELEIIETSSNSNMNYQKQIFAIIILPLQPIFIYIEVNKNE